MKDGGGADKSLPRKKVRRGGRKGGRRLPDVKADITELNSGIVHDRSMRSKEWV